MSKQLIVLLVLGIAGCSNKVMYNNLHLEQRNKCANEPMPTYYECIERANQSYEEYEREHKEILETQK